MSTVGTKWRTARRLAARGDWRAIGERIVGNALRMLGGFDPAKPKFFARWQAQHPARDAATLERLLGTLERAPLVSVLVPVYNVEAALLDACVESVRRQIYPGWELILANDASTAPHVAPQLDGFAADARIRVIHRAENGGIAAASTTALEHARGEWIALLDNDDTLTPDALAEMVLAISREPDAEWAYSDFVLERPDGQLASPYFKPDFSPERLMSQMYLNHLQLMRRAAVLEVGGFRPGFDGSQDLDLALRMRERRSPVVHVPRVLYHWRITPGSTTERYDAKPYANEAAKRALRSALVRDGLALPQDGGDGRNACDVHVEDGRAPGVFRVDYHLGRVPHDERPVVSPQPLVSIIIPFRDGWSVTERCLSSIVGRSSYMNYELLLVDNGSRERVTREGIEAFCAAHRNVRCFRQDAPFNHSALNNFAAKQSGGEVLLLLNNDIEIDTDDWLQRMLVHAQRPTIGAVGCLLLYPNRTIQHAGIILGIGGVAGHAYKGHGEAHAGYFGSVAAVQNVSAVTAACLMVRKALYEEVGGLDEDALPTSFNDVDFCLRLRQRGLRNVYTGHATLLHHESYTRRKDPNEDQYRRIMHLRWGPVLQHDPYFSANLSLEWEDYRFGV